MKKIKEIFAAQTEMAAWRQALHARPELAFQETETTRFVRDKLESFGCDAVHLFEPTGVVAVLRGRQDNGRSIMLRADMDALPIVEKTGKPYASQNHGVMHACGHDGHMAMLLGAAKHLAATRDFAGTVYLVFQPAEERYGGAREMIRQGLFEKFPADAVFGMHNFPKMPLGMMGTVAGDFFAAIDTFDICFGDLPRLPAAEGNILRLTFKTEGGHSAMPDPVKDIVTAAGELAGSARQALGPFSLSTSSPAFNVLSDSVTLEVVVPAGVFAAAQMLEERAEDIARQRGLELQVENVTGGRIEKPVSLAVLKQMAGALAGVKAAASTEIPSGAPAIFSVGAVFSDDGASLHAAGTIRTFDSALRDRLMQRARDLSMGGSVSFGENYPVLTNSADETVTALAAARRTAGSACTMGVVPRVPNSEDFSFYLQERPGNFMILGTGRKLPALLRNLVGRLIDKGLRKGKRPDPKSPLLRGIADLHTARYDFNDRALPIGASYWVNLVREYLSAPASVPAPAVKPKPAK